MEFQQRVTPFLMFEGDAEAAMNLYVGLFQNSEIVEISRYGPGEAGKAGTIQRATFRLGSQRVVCIDSPINHEFTFTPAFSMFAEFSDQSELDACYKVLADDGQVLMPLNEYDFSKRFAWVQDRFGISWQLILVDQ